MGVLKTVGRNDDLRDGGDATDAVVHVTGEIGMWPGLTAPTGWLLCVGTLVPTSTYSRLFAKIGHAFNGGADPGGSTFKLPDFRGRFPVGSDFASITGLGLRGGSGMAHSHGPLGLSVAGHTHTPGTLVMDAHGHGHTLYLPSHTHPLTLLITGLYDPSEDTNITRAYSGATEASGDLDIQGGIDATSALGLSGSSASAAASAEGATADATADATATYPYLPINFIIKT